MTNRQTRVRAIEWTIDTMVIQAVNSSFSVMSAGAYLHTVILVSRHVDGMG